MGRTRLLRLAHTLAWAVVFAIGLFGVMAIVTVALRATDADVYSYQRGVRAILSGVTPYAPHQLAGPYRLGEVSWGNGFVYPPTAVVALWPYTLGPFAIGIVKAVNAVALLSVVALIAWRETRSPLIVGSLLALTLIHPGMHVREGQVEPLLAAGIGALWLWPAGWLAVAGGLVKLHPLAGLVWVARRGGSLLLPVVTLIVFVGAWALLWPALWQDWLTATLNARPDCNAIGWVSVACVSGVRWLGPLLAVLLLVGTWRVRSDAIAFWLMTLAILAAAPDTYASYWLIPWVGLLPIAAHLFKGLGRRGMSTARRPVASVQSGQAGR